MHTRSDFGDNDGGWEFETLRSRDFSQHCDDVHDGPATAETESQDYEQHTIRASVSTSALPTSLRVLFEDTSTPQLETYRPLLPSAKPPQPLFSPGLTPSSEKTLKAPVSQTMLQITQSDNSGILPVALSSQQSQTGKLGDVGSDDPSDSAQQEVPRVAESDQTSSRFIQIPDPQTVPDAIKHPSTSPNAVGIEPEKPSTSSLRPFANRQRSRSSAEVSDHHLHDRDLASPAAFRFPLNPKTVTSGRGETGDSFDATSGSKPSEPGLLSSHQAAYSLDTTSRRAALQPHAPSPVSRARSATAIQPPRISSDSKASNSVDDTTIELPKQPVRVYSDRNGAEVSFSSNHTLGTPGLKDVLKVRRTPISAHLTSTKHCYRFRPFLPNITSGSQIYCHRRPRLSPLSPGLTLLQEGFYQVSTTAARHPLRAKHQMTRSLPPAQRLRFRRN